MAITLRYTATDTGGKTGELTYQEMNDNFKSYYYSSSYSNGTLYLHTTSSATHSIDLSGFVDDLETGSLLRISAFNTATGSFVTTASAALNVLTFTKGDGTTFNVTVNTGSGGGGGSTDYVSNVTLTGTDLQFTGVGSAFNSSVGLSNLTAAINSFTGSAQTNLNTLNAATSSYVTNNKTGSFYYSSSVDQNVITFFQGDGTPESVTINTGSLASSITNNVNNYVLTATGAPTINGEANLTFDGTRLSVRGDISASGDLYAAGLDNTTQVNVVGYSTSTGKLTYFSTASIFASSYDSNHDIVETLNNDIVIYIDSNSGTSPAYERIINDASGTGLPNLDEINGRTILIDQANTTEGTLRFGFGNWTGTAGRRTFTVDIYNRGTDTFLIGAYVPAGTWKIYLQGHDNGGGDVYQTYDTSFTGADTFYGPHGIREGAYARLFYDFTLKVVVIWCSSWTGTLGGAGNTNL
jgi:hypothetical protein